MKKILKSSIHILTLFSMIFPSFSNAIIRGEVIADEARRDAKIRVLRDNPAEIKRILESPSRDTPRMRQDLQCVYEVFKLRSEREAITKNKTGAMLGLGKLLGEKGFIPADAPDVAAFKEYVRPKLSWFTTENWMFNSSVVRRVEIGYARMYEAYFMMDPFDVGLCEREAKSYSDALALLQEAQEYTKTKSVHLLKAYAYLTGHAHLGLSPEAAQVQAERELNDFSRKKLKLHGGLIPGHPAVVGARDDSSRVVASLVTPSLHPAFKIDHITKDGLLEAVKKRLENLKRQNALQDERSSDDDRSDDESDTTEIEPGLPYGAPSAAPRQDAGGGAEGVVAGASRAGAAAAEAIIGAAYMPPPVEGGVGGTSSPSDREETQQEESLSFEDGEPSGGEGCGECAASDGAAAEAIEPPLAERQQTQRRRKKAQKLTPHQESEILRLGREGVPAKEVASQLGVCYASVRKRYTDNGIQIRVQCKITSEMVEEMLRLGRSGMTASAVAEEMGLDPASVVLRFKKHNLKVHRRTEINKEMEEKIIRLAREERMSAQAIAKRLGVGRTPVFKRLKKAGLVEGKPLNISDGTKLRVLILNNHNPSWTAKEIAKQIRDEGGESISDQNVYKILHSRGRKRYNKAKPITPEMDRRIVEWYTLYQDQRPGGKKISEIAEALGITKPRVSEILKNKGVTVGNRTSKQTIKKLYATFEAGESYRELVKKQGITKGAVSYHLKKWREMKAAESAHGGGGSSSSASPPKKGQKRTHRAVEEGMPERADARTHQRRRVDSPA